MQRWLEGSRYGLMLLVLIFLVCWPAAAAPRTDAPPSPFEEVPARSWPYAVVDYFVARGLVSGYEGGLYASGRTLTRYELALMTAHVVDAVGTTEVEPLDEREVHWLQSLVKEYHRELVLMGYHLESDGLPLTGQGLSLSLRVGRMGGVLGGRGTGSSLTNGSVDAVSALAAIPAASRTGEMSGVEGAPEPGREFRLAPSVEGLERVSTVYRASAASGEDAAWEVAGPQGAARDGDGEVRDGAVAGAPESQGAEGATDGSPQRSETILAMASGNGETTGGGGSVRLGARATFRVVERLDQEWAPPLAFPSPDRFAQPEEEWRSYDFILDLGDVRIAAPRPEPGGGSLRPADFSAGPVMISPGVSLVPRVQARNWALYEEVENVRTTTSSRAGLDMDLFIPSARLRLGWRYEGELESPLLRGGRMTVAGMEYQLDSRAQAVAGVAFSDKEEGATRTTQLGLRYELGRNSSLLLGYRLIDFTSLQNDEREDIRAKMATAEFSIRF